MKRVKKQIFVSVMSWNKLDFIFCTERRQTTMSLTNTPMCVVIPFRSERVAKQSAFRLDKIPLKKHRQKSVKKHSLFDAR